MKVVTIIVTYNRLSLLQLCIESVRKQTCKIDTLLVINNGSTDGTKEWLDAQNEIKVIHQENVGGAGGFKTGVKTAFEADADWIWMMDDDVFPREDCLEKLLSFSDQSLCLHPQRIYADGVKNKWNRTFDLENYRTNKCTSDKNKEISFVSSGCFEGMLIHRDIVSAIGYPDSRFFIAGDDTIYGFLANQLTPVCFVHAAIMDKAIKSTDLTLRPFYLYYLHRNFHLQQEYYCKIFHQKKYPFKVRLKYFFRSIYGMLLITLSEKYKTTEKWKLLRAISLGMRDNYMKKKFKTF